MVGGLAFGGRGPGRPPERRLVVLLVVVAAGIAVLALVADRFQLGAGMVVAGLGIAPAIACLYLLIDRLAPAGTVTEAFAWVNSAFGTGIAAGNATGGAVVHRAGADAVFLLAAAAVVVAALVARVRRPALAERRERPRPPAAAAPCGRGPSRPATERVLGNWATAVGVRPLPSGCCGRGFGVRPGGRPSAGSPPSHEVHTRRQSAAAWASARRSVTLGPSRSGAGSPRWMVRPSVGLPIATRKQIAGGDE
jgi:MFS family permease